jgi:hypothetical protein
LIEALALLVRAPASCVRCLEVTFEFDFRSGRTDLVGIDEGDELHAFEAKLTKWKKALEQAARNTNYAHYTYVVLPSPAAAAIKARDQFERRGIGLLVVGETDHRMEIAPKRSEPLLPWLTDSAKRELTKA